MEWRHESGVETCGLVIEVKHYKRSASTSFGHVLADYSRAFPTAEVYLVNHGPIGDATSSLPRELLVRCHTIRDLTALHVSARDGLREAVRKYVGNPVRAARAGAGKRAATQTDTVLAVDVSGSMSGYLGKPNFFEMVREIADERCGNAALIDVGVRAVVPLEKLPEAIMSADGGTTNLTDPVRKLLGTFKRVLVITDASGLDSLRQMSNQTIISTRPGLTAVEVWGSLS